MCRRCFEIHSFHLDIIVKYISNFGPYFRALYNQNLYFYTWLNKYLIKTCLAEIVKKKIKMGEKMGVLKKRCFLKKI